MKKRLIAALAMCLVLFAGAQGAGDIDMTEAERRAREILTEKLGCPASMQLIGTFAEGSYSAVYFNADAQIARDFEDMRPAYGLMFSYDTEDHIKVSVDAFFDRATDAPVSFGITHNSRTPHYADKGPVTGAEMDITQDRIDDVIAQVESRLSLTGLAWHMDGRTFNNWGPCLRVRAQVAEDCVLSILIGCDDGREHGLELNYGTLTDTLPVYVNRDG